MAHTSVPPEVSYIFKWSSQTDKKERSLRLRNIVWHNNKHGVKLFPYCQKKVQTKKKLAYKLAGKAANLYWVWSVLFFLCGCVSDRDMGSICLWLDLKMLISSSGEHDNGFALWEEMLPEVCVDLRIRLLTSVANGKRAQDITKTF